MLRLNRCDGVAQWMSLLRVFAGSQGGLTEIGRTELLFIWCGL